MSLDLNEVLTVVAQLFDRLDDVGQRRVLLVLLEAGRQLGLPAAAQFLQRRHVEITVMEERFELRHATGHETAVLADRIAAHRRLVLRHVMLEKFDQLEFGLGFRHGRRLHAVDQSRLAVGALVPVVHLVECFIRLVDREHRAFGDDVQVRIGDDDGDLNDAVVVRVEARHFHVEPDEVEFIGTLGRARHFGRCRL